MRRLGESLRRDRHLSSHGKANGTGYVANLRHIRCPAMFSRQFRQWSRGKSNRLSFLCSVARLMPRSRAAAVTLPLARASAR